MRNAAQIKTGWPPGMLQDDDRKLSRWLANRIDSRNQAREAVEAISSSIKTEADRTSIESIVPPFGNGVCQSGERIHVGNALSAISDSERELHITACARLMEMAMLRWHESGNFADRGEADRWRLLMEEAIKGRSPATVARMELERGLDGR